MKKTIIGVCTTLLIAVFMTGCSNDDDSDLSSVERSLVGCWQVVEHFNYSHQEPINGIQVIEFKSDRTQSFYQDGELQYETQFWAKPTKNEDGYYLCHQPDEDYSQSTYSCGFEIVGNILTIWESGCFNVSKTVYQRIPSLNAADPEVGAYKYGIIQLRLKVRGIWQRPISHLAAYMNLNLAMSPSILILIIPFRSLTSRKPRRVSHSWTLASIPMRLSRQRRTNTMARYSPPSTSTDSNVPTGSRMA
jgi:hypothetical protein